MGVPVTKLIEYDQATATKNITMSIYLPNPNPPQPTEDGVLARAQIHDSVRQGPQGFEIPVHWPQTQSKHSEKFLGIRQTDWDVLPPWSKVLQVGIWPPLDSAVEEDQWSLASFQELQLKTQWFFGRLWTDSCAALGLGFNTLCTDILLLHNECYFTARDAARNYSTLDPIGCQGRSRIVLGGVHQEGGKEGRGGGGGGGGGGACP